MPEQRDRFRPAGSAKGISMPSDVLQEEASDRAHRMQPSELTLGGVFATSAASMTECVVCEPTMHIRNSHDECL